MAAAGREQHFAARAEQGAVEGDARVEVEAARGLRGTHPRDRSGLLQLGAGTFGGGTLSARQFTGALLGAQTLFDLLQQVLFLDRIDRPECLKVRCLGRGDRAEARQQVGDQAFHERAPSPQRPYTADHLIGAYQTAGLVA